MPATKSAIIPSRDKRLQRGERGGIELLLIQSVDHLGKQGDVVEVKRGYAMNYLLPQGLATVATDHHKRMVDKHKAKLLQIQHERLAGLRQLADRIAAAKRHHRSQRQRRRPSVRLGRRPGNRQGAQAARHYRHRRPGAAERSAQGIGPVHGRCSFGPRDRSAIESLGRADRRRSGSSRREAGSQGGSCLRRNQGRRNKIGQGRSKKADAKPSDEMIDWQNRAVLRIGILI